MVKKVNLYIVEASGTYAIVSLSSNVLYTSVLVFYSLSSWSLLRHCSVILDILKRHGHEINIPKDVSAINNVILCSCLLLGTV